MTVLIAVDGVQVGRELAIGKAAANDGSSRHEAAPDRAVVDAVHNRARNQVRRRGVGFSLRRGLSARLPLRYRHAAAEQHYDRQPEQGSGGHGSNSPPGTATRLAVALSPAFTVIDRT